MADNSTKKTDDHKKPSKKSQIVALYLSGMHDVEDLAMVVQARPSYIGSVLREAGLEQGYFDLYTSTSHPMNAYSKFFANKLGFKDVEVARESVELIDTMYDQFATGGDRAGQHHAMMMAMTMGNRAHFTGKHKEAMLFRSWLIDHLEQLDAQSDEALNASDDAEEEE